MGCNASQEVDEEEANSDFLDSLPPHERHLYQSRNKTQKEKDASRPALSSTNDFLSALVKAGAEDNPRDQNWLLCVCRRQLWDQFDQALNACTDINARDGQADFTALHWVAYHGNLECAKKLLLRGANPSLVSRTLFTGQKGPLNSVGVAKMQGNMKVAHLLSRFGHESHTSTMRMSAESVLPPHSLRTSRSKPTDKRRKKSRYLHYVHQGPESGSAKAILWLFLSMPSWSC